MSRIEGWESVFAAMQAFEERLETAVHDTAVELCQDTQEDIRESISTPYPPASQAGEAPHLRTGSLQGGVEFEVESDKTGSTGIVTSERRGGPREVPGILEYNKDRPYMAPARERLSNTMRQRTITHLRSRLGI